MKNKLHQDFIGHLFNQLSDKLHEIGQNRSFIDWIQSISLGATFTGFKVWFFTTDHKELLFAEVIKSVFTIGTGIVLTVILYLLKHFALPKVKSWISKK